jgi:signal recognition particle subunit SRP54
MLEGQFTLDDFLEQMQQLKKMGPLQNLIGMLPGLPSEMRNVQVEDSELARIEAIIKSMTPSERANPDQIDASRRTRIANGSGTNPNQVTMLVKQFSEMQRFMKRLGGNTTKKLKKKQQKRAARSAKGAKGGRVTPKGTQAKRPTPVLPGLDKLGAGDMEHLADQLDGLEKLPKRGPRLPGL